MKLYILIQQLLRRKFVQYFVLFFILISIIAVIASSFEEMATYKVLLFGITYVSSFIFLIEYTARIVSAPALYPGMKTAKARLKYTFSFYGFVDFVAVLPCVLTYAYWDTEVVHVIILPYIFIIFKLIRTRDLSELSVWLLLLSEKNLKQPTQLVSLQFAFPPF